MARNKTWSDEDRERALEWVANKAKTGAVFRDQAGTADDMLPALAAIEDPAGFAIALQQALTTTAWKRLLGALRQRKHQAQQDDGQQADDQEDRPQACQSCARLKTQVASLQQQLAGAIDASTAKAKEDRGQRHRAADDADGHQVEAKAYQVAALALTCSAMAAGKRETEAARVISGRLRDVQRERGEERDIGTAEVQQWLRQAGGQRLAPASADIRDAAIRIMDEAGESKRAIARALNIADGTVRNVLKRQQVEAA